MTGRHGQDSMTFQYANSDLSENVPSDRSSSERIANIYRELPHPERQRGRDHWRPSDAGRSLRTAGLVQLPSSLKILRNLTPATRSSVSLDQIHKTTLICLHMMMILKNNSQQDSVALPSYHQISQQALEQNLKITTPAAAPVEPQPLQKYQSPDHAPQFHDTGAAEGRVLDSRSWKLPSIALAFSRSSVRQPVMLRTHRCLQAWEPYEALDKVEARDKPDGASTKLGHRVIDAKALYDVLTKDEIQLQPALTSAQQTLLCTDKLACSCGKTMWVSSELQYADGLAKQSAATLFAQRLGSHMMRLKSDTSFQAFKKKKKKVCAAERVQC